MNNTYLYLYSYLKKHNGDALKNYLIYKKNNYVTLILKDYACDFAKIYYEFYQDLSDIIDAQGRRSCKSYIKKIEICNNEIKLYDQDEVCMPTLTFKSNFRFSTFPEVLDNLVKIDNMRFTPIRKTIKDKLLKLNIFPKDLTNLICEY